MTLEVPEHNGRRLPATFYQRVDVVAVARDLLGKYLVTCFDGRLSSGRIVETEAYRGPDDKASHAFSNRRTHRTNPMFGPGGRAYVYLCYGLHHLFNVVTAKEDQPHAVLIRAIEPVDNVGLMLKRRQMTALKPRLTAGPGVLSQALGITSASTGQSLTDPGSPIWLEDRNDEVPPASIECSPRIGVDYAEECAGWPWRFFLNDSIWVSGKRR